MSRLAIPASLMPASRSPWTWFWQGLLTVLCVWLLWHALDWAVLKAVFRPDLAACKALEHGGACWGVVAEKWQSWLFGRYPTEHHGRPALTLALWAASLAWALWPLLRSPKPGATPATGPGPGLVRRLIGPLALWFFGLALLAGGWAGLPAVDSTQWGGLPLTLLLTMVSLVVSLPLALLLAWGRLSRRAWLSWPATAVIEVVRGAPLVMWLFMAAFLLPALMPASWHVGPVARVLVVTIIFSAVYAAEVLRGALRVVADEQSEAAQVLGTSWWTAQYRIIVPQALRTALPSLTSHSIGLLKDTSLVMIVSLQDLTGAMSVSLNGDVEWRPFFLEAYLVIAVAYALMCLGVAAVGRRLEQRYPALGHGQ